MRKLNGFLWICTTLVMATTAQAQIQIVVDNQTIPTEDIESIVILPNSNLISIATTVGYTVEKSNVNPPPDSVAITGFSASPISFVEGQSTTLSWTTSNASSCTASGGAGGWANSAIALPNGSKSISITSAGTYSFTLTCQDASGGTVQRTRVVTVDPKVTDPVVNCSTPPLTGSTQLWNSFWDNDFPGPKYDSKYATVSRFGYFALKFDTDDINDDGRIFTIETTQTDGVRLGAISQCPGDFDVDTSCKYVWGLGGGLTWATNGKSGACQLEQGKTYYFNLTFTDGKSSSTTSCDRSPCVTTLQATNF